MILRTSFWVGVFSLSLLLGTRSAYAVLGGAPMNMKSDQKIFAATEHRTTSAAAYRRESFSNKAVSVREYTNNGRVFAVAWSGIANPPNMSQLLGDYAKDFEVAAQKKVMSRKLGRTPHRVVTGDRVVVKTSGHLRALRGLAYAPELVPAGVNIDDLN